MGIGLALAGGGLKGVAHIGALKALEELDIKIDYISGTSSGSIIACLYAMGYDNNEMKEAATTYYKELTKMNKSPLFKAGLTYMIHGVAQVEGLIPGEKVEKIVEKLAEKKNMKNMSDIKIPFAVATVDTITAKECIFLSRNFKIENEDIDYLQDAPIATAIRASMAFPGIFTPCNYKGYNFIDGGTRDDLPVHVLKDMGASKTLALSFKLDEYEPKEDVFAILLRTVDIFSLKDIVRGQKEADLSIEIDAQGTSLLEIDNMDKCIKKGYDAIMNNKDKIKKVLESVV